MINLPHISASLVVKTKLFVLPPHNYKKLYIKKKKKHHRRRWFYNKLIFKYFYARHKYNFRVQKKLLNVFFSTKSTDIFSARYKLFYAWYQTKTLGYQDQLNVDVFLANLLPVFELYFSSITSIYFKLKFCNAAALIPVENLAHYTQALRRFTPKKFKILYFEEVAELVLSTFITKNINFLILWVKKNIETRPLKFFRAFVHYVYIIVLKLAWQQKNQNLIRGFYFRYSGKFLKGGGKKKKIIYRQGELSSTNKSLRIVYKSFYIRTISGIIGCTFKLAY